MYRTDIESDRILNGASSRRCLKVATPNIQALSLPRCELETASSDGAFLETLYKRRSQYFLS